MGEFFIRRPIVAMVISILIVLLGLFALNSVPVEQYPNITPPSINITANFSGASAVSVEQAVATPIEQKMNGIENMIYMRSTNTSDGKMSLAVTFDVGTDLDNANMLTQNRVKQAEPFMPSVIKQTGIQIKKSNAFPLLIVSLNSSNPLYDAEFLSNYANINMVDILSRVPGVGEISLYGGAEYAMRIWLKPDMMAKLGVTVDDIRSALNDQNAIAPGGKFGAEPSPKGTAFTYSVMLQDRLVSEEEFGNIILKSTNEAATIRLKDVARVKMGADNYFSFSRRNGDPTALIGIFQIPGSNALQVAESVKAKLKELEQDFPEGLSQTVSLDTTLAITAGIDEIVHTLLEAIFLVIVVVFIFLQNWRATLIPLLTVPVSLIGAIAVFPLLGFSVNVLSLLGLVLAIGIVVDDAIVVVEAVMHHIEHGKSPREATIQAMKEVSGPVIAIALILIAVFVPVAFTPGITGQFYKQFAITIAVSVAFSALNALTLSPALSALLLKPTKPVSEQKGPLAWFFTKFNNVFDKVTGGYTGMAGYFARKTVRLVIAILIISGGAVLLGLKVPSGFVPEEDQGYFMVSVMLPSASSLQRTDIVCRKVEAVLSKEKDLDSYSGIMGFSLLSNAIQSNAAFFFVSTKEWSNREQTVAQLVQKLNGMFAFAIPDATVYAFGPPPVSGLGTGAGFTMMLQDRGGNTPQYLQMNAYKFLAAASQRPEIGRVSTLFNAASPQVKLDIDREKAMKLGISTSQVSSTIGAFLGGQYINDFNKYGRQYKVFIQSDGLYRVSPDDLSNIFVRSNKGEMFPLTTVVSSQKISGPEFTNRFNLYRSAEISGVPAKGYTSEDALNALEEVAKQVLPQDMGYEWANMSYQERKAGGSAASVFMMALIFVFLILAAQYESWKLPFSVLLGTPFALLGAFLGLFLARFGSEGYLNNIFAQIGLVLLIGLAAKNAILIVEFAKMKHEEGMSLLDAAMYSAKLRFRPILMTAFAFILGVVPLLTASGAGAESRKVMGMTVFSGMLVATVLGVVLIPALYVFIERLGKKKEISKSDE